MDGAITQAELIELARRIIHGDVAVTGEPINPDFSKPQHGTFLFYAGGWHLWFNLDLNKSWNLAFAISPEHRWAEWENFEIQNGEYPLDSLTEHERCMLIRIVLAAPPEGFRCDVVEKGDHIDVYHGPGYGRSTIRYKERDRTVRIHFNGVADRYKVIVMDWVRKAANELWPGCENIEA